MLNTGRLWADVRIAEVTGKGKLVGNKHVKKHTSLYLKISASFHKGLEIVSKQNMGYNDPLRIIPKLL